MAHKCGLPYVVPRAHSIHGPSPSGLANRSVDNLPHTSTIDALHSDSHIKDSMISAQQEQRLIKSEHGSPHFAATNPEDQFNAQMSPLDLSALEQFSAEYDFMPFDTFTPIDNNDQPIFSAGLSSTSIDWSHYDGLDFNNNNFAAPSYSQAQSFTGFDFSSIDQPALTTSTSEEDFGSAADGATCSALNKQFGSEASDLGDRDGYRLSTSSSYLGLKQVQLLAGNNDLESLSMEDFLKCNNSYASSSNHGLRIDDFSNEAKFLQSSPDPNDISFQLPAMDDNEALWMNDFTTNGCNNHIGTSDNRENHTWHE